ncbi:MAG: type III pantothenate kinase [Anaerotignaceae bacterium]
MMILVIDVGNTEMLLGVYEEEFLIASWRMTTSSLKTSDEIGTTLIRFLKFDSIDVSKIKDVIISSVVPTIMYSLVRGVRKYFAVEPIIVNSQLKSDIKVNMKDPTQLGNDRLAKMAAAYEIYGGPVMVIDYSTATTFDVVSKDGEFITGITAPGINVCAEAMSSKTAQLPKIEIKKPNSIYCRDIVSCIQSGIYYGHIGEAKYIIENVKKEMKFEDLKVVATGGMARSIDPKQEIFDVLDPFLTFKGLRILYEKNKIHNHVGGIENGSCN